MTSIKTQLHLENVSANDKKLATKEKLNGLNKDNLPYIPESMSISIASVSSSLTSPGDSGVQLLDSESDIASIMSMSGQDFTFSDCSFDKCDTRKQFLESVSIEDDETVPQDDSRNSVILNTDFQTDSQLSDLNIPKTTRQNIVSAENKSKLTSDELHLPLVTNLMTTSDIANQNTTPPMYDYKVYSHSAPSESSQSYLPPSTTEEIKSDTKQTDPSETDPLKVPVVDKDNVMQASVIAPMVDEQIVYRRQRRKKLKSQDTPKKRVSFHEDILNSTKIDDIHIDRGFVTRQPGISINYYNEELLRKRGVVVGRYSWAAEGDSPYYQNNMCPEREVKSDIIYGGSTSNTRGGYGSNSSSSSLSLDSTNSDSSGDSPHDEYCPGIINGIKNIKKVPKSSCLKKPKSGRNYIDTKIVQEESPHSSRRNLTRKISESNILDTNIFGSLKNIYKTLSSSVPLAERGVPEGQEDFTTFSSTENLNRAKRNSYSSTETLHTGKSSSLNVQMVCEPEIVHPVQMYKKPNLRLSRSEGFYPNYPTANHNQQENIILCDSNVYEHRGISYSYEYDQFQSNFNKDATNKSKSSTVYQMLLNEISFLKKSPRQSSPAEKNADKKDMKKTNNTPNNSENNSPRHSATTKKMSTSTNEWGSDTESTSDISEKTCSRHLQSPSRKRNLKPNHYSIQNTNLKLTEQDNSTTMMNISDNSSDIGSSVSTNSDKINIALLKPATSKTSLITRFLRNVTQRKLLSAKLLSNDNRIDKNGGGCLSFYIKNIKPNANLVKNLNEEIRQEITYNQQNIDASFKMNELHKFRKKINHQLFRDEQEVLLDVFRIKTAYNKKGESRPMLTLLTNTTLYVSTLSRNQIFYNEFIIPYTELHFLLLGPNRQSVYISNVTKSLCYMIMTGNAEQTSEIVGKIEYAMRNDLNRPQLPAIKELTMHDMYQLRYAIYKQTPVTEDEDFHYYSLINLQEDQLNTANSTPLGPFREGFLMYRKAAQAEHRWEFGYFILKGGVLYNLTSPSCRIPVKVIPLQDGQCQGAHRTPPRPRPHTFELLTESESLEFAASDEYEASDWLQALVQSASGMQVTDDIPHATCCSLVLTTDHLVTVRECFELKQHATFETDDECIKALSYAAISDLISFKVPLAAQSWCVLEFACREVHETSGDWILYFSSNMELDKFLSVLEMLWSYNNSQGDSFPLTTVTETDLLNRQATETYCILQQSWIAFQ